MSAPSVNQLPPAGPAFAAAPPTTGQGAPGIVSVNARGGHASHPAARAAFVVGVFTLLALMSVYGVSKWRERERVRQSAAVESAKTENKSALVSRRRNFSSDPVEPPTVPAIEKVASPPSPPPLAAPIPVVRGPAGTVPNQPVLPSRYGGEIIVPSKDGVAASARASASGAQPPQDASRGASIWQPPTSPNLLPIGMSTGQPAGAAGSAALRGTTLLAQAPADYGDEANARGRLPQPGATVPSASPGRAGGDLPDTQGRIGALLRPDVTGAVKATMLGDRNFMLPKGRAIDCSLSTRVVSEVSGMAECVVSSDVYSDNGRVLLLERGSEATGEYVATMAQGQRRLFLLWTRVKTPTGVVINLASPATDALGTAGLPGYIDNRWSDRIGAAVLLSLVQDAIGYATANAVSANGGGSGVGVYTFQNTRSAGERMINQILQQTISIKPTLYKNQGDRASIYVARDLDFSSVYQLTAR